ncbi:MULTISPECIES: penicillin-binding protein 2 [unclassified Sphingobium]|uniref:penicillin-binding protein 2 n=1 Tax=unclassified Sphingobium TaxID=2611147 RepID=UPI0022251FA6|nr:MULTISPECIES: penicillin-binding protein 2 [unclassified Sphingobium]MCW2381738.1 penicillin-binding protein 2 [Sphingobium sp. B2D3B]MCW2398155.1 penicillin-binding protein 2 [Sphingobium sp. B2D3C]
MAASVISFRKILFPNKVVTPASQAYSFNRRTFVLGGAQLAVGGLLVGRMGWIAIAENEKYQLLSDSNRINLTITPPRRGWILDRRGQALASNRTNFRVDIIPDRLRDRERVVRELATLLALTPNDVDRINEHLDRAAGYQPVQVADDLSYEQYAALSVRLPDFPGVVPSQGFSRYYPAGPPVGHLLGYVGTPSAKEYNASRDPLLITPGFKLGKQGLEKSLNSILTGKPGARRVEVTARGAMVRDLETQPDTPGRSIKLTIDAGLQEFAGRRLGTQSGAVVIMDCHTGDILCSTSMPSFDPNSFSEGISHHEWQMLSQDDHVPLRNKTLGGLYPPGSTVKPMIALSFLEAGLPAEATVNCTGALRVGNRLFHCHARRGHGTVNMHRAIEQSCNIYFYYFAQKIGMDAIAMMARRLGLGQRFDLPFPNQSYGTVPDPAWKMKKYNQPWQTYDTVNATIGQGYMLVNPTQMCVMAARLATGLDLDPHFIVDGKRHQGEPLGVSLEHLTVIRNAMKDVVNGGGTGRAARLDVPGVMLAAKTGTAQVGAISTRGQRAASQPFRLRDHALFQGFAPHDNPRYAIATIIEHGGHMDRVQDAPMISGDCITYLYDPAKAMEKLQRFEATWGGTPQMRMERQLNAFRIARGLESAPLMPEPGNAASPAAPTPATPAQTGSEDGTNASEDGDIDAPVGPGTGDTD